MTFLVPASSGRVAWLDALRGFALIGICVANLPLLAGYAFLAPDARAALPLDVGADVLAALVAVFVEAKFYSVFSFLFGLGLALQLRDGRVQAVRRRLVVLFAIGVAHAWLLWWGDILGLYALLGFIVVAWRPSPRAALRGGIALLLAPIAIYAFYVVAAVRDPFAGSGGPPPILDAAADGTPLDVVQANVTMWIGVWIRRLMRFQALRVLGMFLLGYWFASRLHDAQDLLRRWVRSGFVAGIPLCTLYWGLGGGEHLFPAQASILLGVVASSLGIPLLALAYVGLFGRYWRGNATTSWLVAGGRMPLTNYLLQSLVGVLLFYGWAGAQWQHHGRATLLMISLLLAVAQLGLSHAWLRRHRSGPLEALWRRLAAPPAGAAVLER